MKDDLMHATNYADLATLIEIPADSTISRTIYQDEQVKAVLFGFAAGQELSEHTAATAAMLHFVSGTARVTLGAEQMQVQPNSWVHMPPRLPHSIVAETPVVMLLLMLKGKP
jgi:quercetin dioxygenase-like cupin family protein